MKRIFYILVALVLLTCDDITEVTDISESTITVLAPTDQATITKQTITFTWEDVEDAENYKLQIANPTFDTAIQIEQDTTITKTSFAQTLEPGNYQWRVRAENSGYTTAYTTQQLTIEE